MLDFYRGKKVLVSGHTGFKGSYLVKILNMAGAEVFGYSLEPQKADMGMATGAKEPETSLYEICTVGSDITSHIGDIRDYEQLKAFFDTARPEIVFHLAAQPLVRESYKNPRYTYETNVLGTVNVCECIRNCGTIRSFVNVTTDKVYLNEERQAGYREDEKLDGFDPYSNSKSCSELVTHSYTNSFFKDMQIAVSTARAGNVIGGGDMSADRLVPDLIRAGLSEGEFILRSPGSVRPFQHVLEALSAYLLLARKQYEDISFAGAYNVGPLEKDAVTSGKVAEIFVSEWNRRLKDTELVSQIPHPVKEIAIKVKPDGGPHEAGYLSLDLTKIRSTLGWNPKWDISKAIGKTVDWTLESLAGRGKEAMESLITEYFKSTD